MHRLLLLFNWYQKFISKAESSFFRSFSVVEYTHITHNLENNTKFNNRKKEALLYLEQSLEILVCSLGENHRNVVNSYEMIGDISFDIVEYYIIPIDWFTHNHKRHQESIMYIHHNFFIFYSILCKFTLIIN